MLNAPDVLYTRAPDGTSIAYTTFGEGPLDLLCIPGFVSHLELMFEAPGAENYLGRMASFARVVMYDKRGQGLSDRPGSPPPSSSRWRTRGRSSTLSASTMRPSSASQRAAR